MRGKLQRQSSHREGPRLWRKRLNAYDKDWRPNSDLKRVECWKNCFQFIPLVITKARLEDSIFVYKSEGELDILRLESCRGNDCSILRLENRHCYDIRIKGLGRGIKACGTDLVKHDASWGVSCPAQHLTGVSWEKLPLKDILAPLSLVMAAPSSGLLRYLS